MAQRFQIEDLVEQDTVGVVFQAVDTESGSPVALRRFFPFGPNGDGLNENDRATFAEDLQSLAKINHPALRPIICGGCDPDDHMPFVATEWMEGTSLAAAVEQGALTPETAVSLLDHALQISEMVSQTFGREAVWVETRLSAIIASDNTPEPSFTFWISPEKWIAVTDDSRRGLSPLVHLTEEIMHWRGKAVTETSGKGLGAWFRWLRSSAQIATLQQARQRLAACLGEASAPEASAPSRPTPTAKPPATKPPTVSASPTKKSAPAPLPTPAAPQAKSRFKLPIILGASAFSLLTLGLGGWILAKKASSGELAPKSEEVLSTSSIIEELDRRKKSPAAAANLATETQGTGDRVFAPSDRDALLKLVGQTVTLEGIPASIAHSSTYKTRYLTFSSPDGGDETRVGILVKDADEDLTEEALASLTGKKIRVTGKVRADLAGRTSRPVVMIESRSAIQVR